AKSLRNSTICSRARFSLPQSLACLDLREISVGKVWTAPSSIFEWPWGDCRDFAKSDRECREEDRIVVTTASRISLEHLEKHRHSADRQFARSARNSASETGVARSRRS